MNEQIKQLWEEAAKTTQSDSWEEQTKFMERFAELIVRECVDVAIDNGCGDFVDINQLLLKHFGYE
jgi:leucyl aminopeptidase (aminopeptidase T)